MNRAICDHPAIRSPLFKLIALYECDIDLGEYAYPCRIELFQDTSRKSVFRARIWEVELCRITPRFPTAESGEPIHVADELILLERTGRLGKRFDSFKADNPDNAIQQILKDLIVKLEEWTGESSNEGAGDRQKRRKASSVRTRLVSKTR